MCIVRWVNEVYKDVADEDVVTNVDENDKVFLSIYCFHPI